MTSTFASFSQNGEDVVLWRALGNIPNGRYVEVGANHPTVDSITRAFYDHGWSGLTVEPVPAYAEEHRTLRPRDTYIEAAVTDADTETVTLHQIDQTGLSTLRDDVSARHVKAGLAEHAVEVPAIRLDALLREQGWESRDIHMLIVDVEGAEDAVIRSIDLTVWRPWVLVIEATEPRTNVPAHQSWEPLVLAAGYRFCLFDGLSRYYVAEEHAATLAAQLSYPACALDNFTTLQERERAALVTTLEARVDTLVNDVLQWRTAALDRWAASAGTTLPPEASEGWAEVERMKATLSWRVTTPLRAVRGSGLKRLVRP